MMKNCTNYAVVSDQSTSLCGYVGGIAGLTGGSGLTMINCDNRAAVSGLFNHPTARRELAVGGLIGVNAVANTMDDCDNTGNVTQSNTTAGTIEYVGGLVAYSSPKLTVSNCSSNATVSTTRTVYTYVGALFGRIYAKDSSVSSTKVYGTFEETELNADNLALCYGVASEFKATDGITYGKDN